MPPKVSGGKTMGYIKLCVTPGKNRIALRPEVKM